MEALYQVATGQGYDQNCDGHYDSSTDILPYRSSSKDAFGGGGGESYDSHVEGAGTSGGVGWREGAMRVVLLATDNEIRDPDAGHDVLGGCSGSAGYSDVVQSFTENGVKFMGINVYEYQTNDPTLQSQLNALATGTESYIENGNTPAVFFGSWNWPSVHLISDALWDLSGPGQPRSFRVALGNDPQGWISDLETDTVWSGLTQGDSFQYHFHLRTAAPVARDDQFYQASIQILNEDGESVTEEPVWVVIRPEGSY